MIRRILLILTAVILLNPTSLCAQETRLVDTELKAKAYELLESLATQIGTLQSAENRARIGSNIADSIWSHDEKRARALFVAVGQDIRWGLAPPESNDRQSQLTLTVFLQLRADTIDRIAKYDPEFAFEFFKATEPAADERMPAVAREKERALALRLGKQVANANPEIALKLGRIALANGLSGDLLTLLRPLLRKHREQGVTLYKETVEKVSQTKVLANYQTVNFLTGLTRITPPLADETAFKELINVLVKASLQHKCDQDTWDYAAGLFCGEVAPLLAQMEAVDPRAAKLKHLAQEPVARPWAPEAYEELEELLGANDIDGLVRLADRYPELKNTILWRAFDLARYTGDWERAKKIANSYDFSPDTQRQMFEQI